MCAKKEKINKLKKKKKECTKVHNPRYKDVTLKAYTSA